MQLYRNEQVEEEKKLHVIQSNRNNYHKGILR